MESWARELGLVCIDQILEFLVAFGVLTNYMGRGSRKRCGKVEKVVCCMSTESGKSFRLVGADLMDDSTGWTFCWSGWNL
jgi:hypothetical protein